MLPDDGKPSMNIGTAISATAISATAISATAISATAISATTTTTSKRVFSLAEPAKVITDMECKKMKKETTGSPA